MNKIDMYSDDIYEKIVFDNNIYKDEIIKALEIVKKFIIERKLVLTGGMSIDMALRINNDSIYSDDELPDYDFYSANFHNDAYDLALLLIKNKFEGVDVINAIHPSTMKVRVKFETVADITYMPENIRRKLPVLKYKGMIIVHPNYQMIDQHISLSKPLENPPRETVKHRWKKDIKRYNILYKYYPLDNIKLSDTESDTTQMSIPVSLMKGQCIGGFLALGYWYNKINNVKNKFNIDIKNKYNFSYNNGHMNIRSRYVSIYSDDIWKLKDKLSPKSKSIEYYNSLMEKLPRKMIIDDKWELYDNNGTLLSATKDIDMNIHVANLQTIMVHMLCHWNFYNCHKYLEGYLYAKKIVSYASEMYIKTSMKEYLKFLPDIEIYGKNNWSYMFKSQRETLNKIFNYDKEKKNVNIQEKPNRLFPNKINDKLFIENIRKFDPVKSPIYQFDGKRTDSFSKYELPE